MDTRSRRDRTTEHDRARQFHRRSTGGRRDLATAILGGLGLDDPALTDAATTELPLSTYHYGFELVQGATCILIDRWTALSPDDAEIVAELTTLIEAISAAATEAGHDRAVELILTPLEDMVNGRLPQTELAAIASETCRSTMSHDG